MSESLIQLIEQHQALQVGEFVLKSGIKSPVFFNFGLINTATGLSQLGEMFRDRILEQGWAFDYLVGPAYKGIPIATATAVSLAALDNMPNMQNLKLAYNRKEAKSHGEGGAWVGDISRSKVVLIDDVLTAGTALSQAVAAVKAAEAELLGVVIALDREQKGRDGKTTADRLQAEWGVPVVSLLTLTQMISYYKKIGDEKILVALQSIAG